MSAVITDERLAQLIEFRVHERSVLSGTWQIMSACVADDDIAALRELQRLRKAEVVEALRNADSILRALYPTGVECGDYTCVSVRAALAAASGEGL